MERGVFVDNAIYNSYTVGEKREEWRKSEGLEMEYDDTAGLLGFAFIDAPTAAERIAIQKNRQFSISFTDFGNLGFLVTSVSGCFIWDAPFSPNIYKVKRNISALENETMGLSLTMLFIDSRTGTLFHIRQIGLGHDFSNRFLRWYQESLDKFGPLSLEDYHKKIDAVYSQYSIQELKGQASFEWSLR